MCVCVCMCVCVYVFDICASLQGIISYHFVTGKHFNNCGLSRKLPEGSAIYFRLLK